MKLFIHTYGRIDRQVTIRQFSSRLRKDTFWVIQKREEKDWRRFGYPKGVTPLVLPESIQTLSPTRQYILEWAVKNKFDKICMMDDDLRFDYRTDVKDWHLIKCPKEEVEKMFGLIKEKLDVYAHVGVSAREGNNHHLEAFSECGRMMRFLAYKPKVVLDAGCRFDRLRTKQDLDMTLQLLRKGFKNLIIYSYSTGQDGSGSEGGCSAYRTFEMMEEDARNLYKLHPDFVDLRRKQTKTAWGKGGAERIDVNIAWQKAYDSSKQVGFFKRKEKV